MKKLIGLFAFTLLLASCASDDKELIKQEENKKVTFLDSKTNNSIHVQFAQYSTQDEKNALIDQFADNYINQIYLKDEFDSKYQVAAAVFEDHHDQKTLVVKYAVMNMLDYSDEDLSFTKELSPIENNTTSKVERLKHYCNGGKKNGQTIYTDRPSKWTAASYANKIAGYASACLDGGGTFEISKAFVANGPNEETIKWHSYKDKLDYIMVMEQTSDLLVSKLDEFVVKF